MCSDDESFKRLGLEIVYEICSEIPSVFYGFDKFFIPHSEQDELCLKILEIIGENDELISFLPKTAPVLKSLFCIYQRNSPEKLENLIKNPPLELIEFLHENNRLTLVDLNALASKESEALLMKLDGILEDGNEPLNLSVEEIILKFEKFYRNELHLDCLERLALVRVLSRFASNDCLRKVFSLILREEKDILIKSKVLLELNIILLFYSCQPKEFSEISQNSQ